MAAGRGSGALSLQPSPFSVVHRRLLSAALSAAVTSDALNQRSQRTFHFQQETLNICVNGGDDDKDLCDNDAFFPPLSYKESVTFGPLNVLKPNILPKFASAFTTCSVTTCWQLQNGRMKVVRYQEPFEPRISIKRSRSHER